MTDLYVLTKDALLWLYKAPKKTYFDPYADFGSLLAENVTGDYRKPVHVTIDVPNLKDPKEYAENPKKRHLADVQSLQFYKSFQGMTPRLATNPYLLAYINHFHLHRYGLSRWPIRPKNKDEHIRRHWLSLGNDAKWESSISGRMWWMAHFSTRAAEASGGAFTPEQALDVFSKTPEYYHRTMDYEVLRNPTLMAECIRVLMREAQGINRDGYREIGKDLNRSGGARLLDSLDRSALRSMVKSSAGRLMRDPKFVTHRRYMAGVEKFKVLSLGAGAQSTVLALMAEQGFEGMEKPDLAVFADTKWEPPAVYEHLEWLKKQLSYEVVTVSAGNIKENILKGVNSDGDKFLDVPVFLRKGDGTNAVAARQCTNHYKITPIRQEIRRRLGIQYGKRFPKDMQVEMWLGISVDESGRAKPSRDEWIDRRFPLMDMGMTRADIYNWFNARYPGRRLPRSACVGCPYHDDMEWKWLKENEPASFEEAVTVDWSLRNVPVARGSLRGEAYLHKSRKPLGEVDFSETRDYDDFMAGECEGLCGV